MSMEVFNITAAEESKTKSKVKVMLITFFKVKGIVQGEFLTQD